MKTQKLNTQEELALSVIVWVAKPAYAITKVIITDSDEVYAVNGSECYRINFIEELRWVVDNTNGNLGWIVEEDRIPFFNKVVRLLYEKDYIGCDQEETVVKFL